MTAPTFDRGAIAKAGHSDIVVVLVTNADDFQDVACAGEGEVTPGTQIISVKK